MFPMFLLTMACAFAGGYVGYRLRLPAGTLMGSLIGVVLLNLIYGQSWFYADIRVVLQLVSGAMIGSRILKKDVLELKKLVLPAILMILMLIVMNLVFGGLIYSLGFLDAATSLFATAPGGMSDMVLISDELGANTAYVGIMQLFRLLIIYLFMPGLFRRILIKEGTITPVSKVSEAKVTGQKEAFPVKRFLLLLAAAAVGGMLFRKLGVAAGAMTGSMICSAAVSIWKGKVKFPGKIKFVLQVCSGAFIGIRVDRACVRSLPELALPLLIMFVGIFLFVFLTSIILHKFCKMDLAVSLMAATPGGIQEMALLSEDLGTDTAKISIMQTVRLVSIYLIFPTMLKAITEWLG